MEAQDLVAREDTSLMAHHRGLVQSWLSVNNQHVSIRQVAMNDLAADLNLVCDSISFLLGHVRQEDLFPRYFILNDVRARMNI